MTSRTGRSTVAFPTRSRAPTPTRASARNGARTRGASPPGAGRSWTPTGRSFGPPIAAPRFVATTTRASLAAAPVDSDWPSQARALAADGRLRQAFVVAARGAVATGDRAALERFRAEHVVPLTADREAQWGEALAQSTDTTVAGVLDALVGGADAAAGLPRARVGVAGEPCGGVGPRRSVAAAGARAPDDPSDACVAALSARRSGVPALPGQRRAAGLLGAQQRAPGSPPHSARRSRTGGRDRPRRGWPRPRWGRRSRTARPRTRTAASVAPRAGRRRRRRGARARRAAGAAPCRSSPSTAPAPAGRRRPRRSPRPRRCAGPRTARPSAPARPHGPPRGRTPGSRSPAPPRAPGGRGRSAPRCGRPSRRRRAPHGRSSRSSISARRSSTRSS